jgi:peptidoglycan/xylan/chitin deacetylase (PgdA/CDA1 family)
MTRLACITLDMEPDHGDPEGHIRLLENPEFFERYISIINKYDVKVTMFTVTSLFEKFGSRFRELGNRIPLEFAPHSHRHDPYDACSRDEIQASQHAFQKFTGLMPIGYRAPIGRINKDGLGHLMDLGFQYDASLYPSIRPGKFGYSNFHMPNVPFRVTRGSDSLIELPFTSMSKIRIVYGLSYAKLFGWGLYSLLLKVFGLPETVVALSHPYDFYTHLVADGLAGAEKFALTRNATRAFDYFEKMILELKTRAYRFIFVSDLCAQVKETRALRQIALEAWH